MTIVRLFPEDPPPNHRLFTDRALVAKLVGWGVKESPVTRGELFVDETCPLFGLSMVWKYVNDLPAYLTIVRSVTAATSSPAPRSRVAAARSHQKLFNGPTPAHKTPTKK